MVKHHQKGKEFEKDGRTLRFDAVAARLGRSAYGWKSRDRHYVIYSSGPPIVNLTKKETMNKLLELYRKEIK